METVWISHLSKLDAALVHASWSRSSTPITDVIPLHQLGQWDFVYPYYHIARSCEGMYQHILSQMPYVGPGSELRLGVHEWCGQYVARDRALTWMPTTEAINSLHSSDTAVYVHDLLISPVGFGLPLPQQQGRLVACIPSELSAKICHVKMNSTDKVKWVDALADTISRAEHVITMLVELWNASDKDMIIVTNTVVMISGGPEHVKRCKTRKVNREDGVMPKLILCYGNTSQAFINPMDKETVDPAFQSFPHRHKGFAVGFEGDGSGFGEQEEGGKSWGGGVGERCHKRW